MKLKIATLSLICALSTQAYATSTKEILANSEISAETKAAIEALQATHKLSATAKWSKDAVEKLKGLKVATAESIQAIRESSELTVDEIKELQSNADDNIGSEDLGEAKSKDESGVTSSAGRQSRPAVAPEGALYIDVYQESPVQINYNNRGNEIKKMSFEVVTRMEKNQNGELVPRFVRAQLISTGSDGHRTPEGEFAVEVNRRHRYYVSRTYGSRMDYAQFFIGGIAIHETPRSNYSKLGGPASHGCVRHSTEDAAAMWTIIGDTVRQGNIANVKVFGFGEEVVFADETTGVDENPTGIAAQVNAALSHSFDTLRR